MAIASINFKPVKASSKVHNERLDPASLEHYLRTDLSKENLFWKDDEISSRFKSISQLAKEKTGRSMQAKATPIREACVNIEEHHSIEDLTKVADALKDQFGIDCFQIFIHRDEGRWIDGEELKKEADRDPAKWKPNYHAHMVFDWQDKTTGKSFKLHRLEMSKIQTLVAVVLGMERGEHKVNSNRERLEPIEYKRQQEELRHQMLQEQNEILEQKKNEVRVRIAKLDREGGKEALSETISQFIESYSADIDILFERDPNELSRGIIYLESEISQIEEQIAAFDRSKRS